MHGEGKGSHRRSRGKKNDAWMGHRTVIESESPNMSEMCTKGRALLFWHL